MVQDADLNEELVSIVTALSDEKGWGLDAMMINRYALVLDKHLPTDASREQIMRTCCCYHDNYVLVEALSNQADPQMDKFWYEYHQLAVRILYKQNLADGYAGEFDVQDLAQEALLEVFRSLSGFHFQSSFLTWAHQVIVNTARRMYRDRRAQKRPPQGSSLEDPGAWERALPLADDPCVTVEAHELALQIQQILTEQGGARLAQIFLRHALEDQTSFTIGAHVHLHHSRVRALLKDARQILHDDPDMQDWLVH